MSTTPAPGNPTFRTLAPLAHCEGVAAGPDGMLWTGDESGRIYRVDPADGSYEQVSEIDAWALGLCLDGEGLVYVCAYDRGTIVRVDPSNGETEVYAGDVGLGIAADRGGDACTRPRRQLHGEAAHGTGATGHQDIAAAERAVREQAVGGGHRRSSPHRPRRRARSRR